MRLVYEAEHLIDAHLVRGRLEHAGIPAWVRGDLLTGGMGGLPVHGLVSVWVADGDVPAALGELAQLQAERSGDQEPGVADGPVDLCPSSGRLD